jgi:RNA polymerase sigma-70 factor (ECF subfamily)
MSDEALVQALLSHLPDGRRTGAPLGPPLRALLVGARAAWPDLHVADADFLAYVAARLTDEAPLCEQIAGLCGADLYLACACLRGDPRALAAFDRTCLASLDAVGARAGFPAALVEEVRQALRVRLLVGETPSLRRYDGRGALRTWVRVVAIREALQLQRRARREVPSDGDEWIDALHPETDIERRYLYDLSREHLGAALAEALRALGIRERSLLRYHYLDRLTLDQIATMYRVHRATIARQLARAREQVLALTRAHLRARVGSESQVDSLLRLGTSDLGLSLRSVLASEKRR